MQSIPPLGAWGIPGIRKTGSGKVVEAQPWQSKFFQQSLLCILSLNQRDLFRFHFAAILRELAVDFAANAEHLLFAGGLWESGVNFFVEDGQTAFEVFEIKSAGSPKKRDDRREGLSEFGQSRGQIGIRGVLLFGCDCDLFHVSVEVASQVIAREWLGGRLLRLRRGAGR